MLATMGYITPEQLVKATFFQLKLASELTLADDDRCSLCHSYGFKPSSANERSRCAEISAIHIYLCFCLHASELWLSACSFFVVVVVVVVVAFSVMASGSLASSQGIFLHQPD